MTKIILGEHIKGGTGLTSVLIETIAELSKHHSVLAIDLTEQRNLTSFFTDQVPPVLKREEDSALTVSSNLDFIRLAELRHIREVYKHYGSYIPEDNVVGKFLYRYDYVVIDTDRPIEKYSLCYWLTRNAIAINVVEPDLFSLSSYTVSPYSSMVKGRVTVCNKIHTDYTLREILEEDEEAIGKYKEDKKEIIKQLKQLNIANKVLPLNYSLSILDSQDEVEPFINKRHKDYDIGDLKIYSQIRAIIDEVTE